MSDEILKCSQCGLAIEFYDYEGELTDKLCACEDPCICEDCILEQEAKP